MADRDLVPQHPGKTLGLVLGDRQGVFDVESNDLLARCVRHAAKDAHLRRRLVTVDAKDAATIDALRGEPLDESRALRIGTDDRDRDRQPPQGEDVVDRVAGPAEENVVAVLAQRRAN